MIISLITFGIIGTCTVEKQDISRKTSFQKIVLVICHFHNRK